jgi:hypothetical protein
VEKYLEYRTIVSGLLGQMASKNMNTSAVESDIIIEFSGFGKLPFVVLLPDSIGSDELPVAVTVGDFCAEIRFLKTINENQHRHGMIMHMEDRRGELSYSEFNFRIVSPDNLNLPLNKYVTDDDNKFCARKATSFANLFINHFVLAYKEALTPQKDWIEEITVELCSPWKQLEAKNIRKETIGSCGLYDSRGTTIMIGNNLSEMQKKILQRGCLATEMEPGAKSFMQLANRARERSDWITHIVYLHTAFEYWVFREVRTFLFNAGLDANNVDAQLLDNPTKSTSKYKSKEKALKLVIGNANFKNSNAYKDYQEKVTNIRSSIIHVKATKIEKDDSDRAAVAFENFSKLLANEIKNKYKELNIHEPKPLIKFDHEGAYAIYDDEVYPAGR